MSFSSSLRTQRALAFALAVGLAVLNVDCSDPIEATLLKLKQQGYTNIR